jgi:hypothetical protein
MSNVLFTLFISYVIVILIEDAFTKATIKFKYGNKIAIGFYTVLLFIIPPSILAFSIIILIIKYAIKFIIKAGKRNAAM